MVTKKQTVIATCLLLAMCFTACGGTSVEKKAKDMTQKTIRVTEKYAEFNPEKADIPDYGQLAAGYDALISGKDLVVKDVPITWEDKTNGMMGIVSYAGGKDSDGAQEGLAQISAVLSASLIGLDETNRNGVNYVQMLHSYFNAEEKVVTNRVNRASRDSSMWYLLYPTLQFVRVSMLYPQEAQIRQDSLDTIESWYQAALIMLENGTFEYTGFDFSAMEPWKNDIWKEPDSAAGIAQLMEYGYKLTGKEEYLNVAKQCLTYCSDYSGSPQYEVLLYSAPYLAAKANALTGTSYSLDNFFSDIFDGSAIPRGGWGQITGTWGDCEVDGMMGSITDRKGYAFTMNTFAAAYAVSPVAKYDPRYAVSLGEWYLNMAINSQNFFVDFVNRDNTSIAGDDSLNEALENGLNAVPFEGIRHSHASQTPWIGGDALEAGWARTDFSMYSGSHTGMFASVFKETDVKGIIRVDCTSAEFDENQWQTWLVYNPYDEDKTITYETGSTEPVDLFNAVKQSYSAQNVSETVKLTIPAGEALVLTQLPAGAALERTGSVLTAQGKFVACDTVTASINNLKNNEKVSNKVTMDVNAATTNPEDKVKQVVVSCADWQQTFDAAGKVTLDISSLEKGSKTFVVSVTTNNGCTDTTSIRLIVE